VSAWDQRFVDLAAHVARWSKDPSTQTGCVVVREDRTIATVGYNGLPRGVADTSARLSDRAVKYAMVVHAEPNALLAAREPLHGCTAYVYPWPPCSSCAAMLIQAGVIRVVAPAPTAEQRERWGASFALADEMYAEAGVLLEAP
jgi:dCMP deaminase